MMLPASAARAVTIETVPVGNPGNPADTRYVDSGVGGVHYAYRIGKYEVTAGQYCEFLNAVAAVDAYGLYDVEMWTSGAGCKIERFVGTGTQADPYQYRVATDWANRPVNYVSWGDAARFCNWLHNGQPAGVQNASTTEDGAYDLSATQAYYGPNGTMPMVDSADFWALNAALIDVNRRPGATWALPTLDEWYKAAYHKNDGPTGNYFDYPTGSDTPPSNLLIDPDPGNNANFYRGFFPSGYTIGDPYYRTEVGEFENSESLYGTFDQGGNVEEWTEAIDATKTRRGASGGTFATLTGAVPYQDAGYTLRANRNSFGGQWPLGYGSTFGFRVIGIPEPNTSILVLIGTFCCLFRNRSRFD